VRGDPWGAAARWDSVGARWLETVGLRCRNGGGAPQRGRGEERRGGDPWGRQRGVTRRGSTGEALGTSVASNKREGRWGICVGPLQIDPGDQSSK
jgi:hypothetical protein